MASEKLTDPPVETFAQALQHVAEGGLLRLIAGKPVEQAIGRLISGMIDVPVAYLERCSQGIRSDTNARKEITSALASAASVRAAEDPELVDRGLIRWTRRLAATQGTREDIAVRTLNIFAQNPEPEGTTAPPEDFMRMFEDIAERASSDELTDLMARILAGEIRKPGSVSRRTLQVVAILDQEIVGALNEIRPYLLDPDWFHIPPSDSAKWHRWFSLLSSVSISTEAGIRSFNFDEHNRSHVKIGNKMIVVTSGPSKNPYYKGPRFIDGSNLTPIGKELISTLPLADEPKVREVARGILEHEFIDKVEVGDISDIGGEPSILNLETIS